MRLSFRLRGRPARAGLRDTLAIRARSRFHVAMRIVAQRVSWAKVTVNGSVVGEIGPGLLLLVGIGRDDSPADRQWLARKCARLRIFQDEEGRMNRSLLDVGGECLAVSQFTLYGDASQGHRPSFSAAAAPQVAAQACVDFVQALEAELGRKVPTGVFGAHMRVESANDGPVTIILSRP